MFKIKIFCLLISIIFLVGCTNYNNTSTIKQDTPSIHTTQPKPTQTIINKENDVIVYITPTGKRFHLKSSCAGKNAIKSFLSEIKAEYTPCKKCAK